MLKNRNLLPPLDYFVAFESAATQESFAAAGKDMNVSESSISRKVKLLEQHFDCALFERGHRSISLTSKGKQLLASVQPALINLIDASQDLGTINHPHTVTLAATNSAATLWLMPRLQSFNAANGRINIVLVSSDSDEKCMAENVDLTILRGEGNWPGYYSKLLFGETVFPVCSPDYIEQNPTQTLTDHPLIDVSSEHSEWMNWRSFLTHTGLENPDVNPSIVVNTYPLAVQAALDGFGVALGWKYLVDLHLASGKLVKPWDDISAATQSGYYLLIPEDRKPFSERDIVEQWLLGQ